VPTRAAFVGGAWVYVPTGGLGDLGTGDLGVHHGHDGIRCGGDGEGERLEQAKVSGVRGVAIGPPRPNEHLVDQCINGNGCIEPIGSLHLGQHCLGLTGRNTRSRSSNWESGCRETFERQQRRFELRGNFRRFGHGNALAHNGHPKSSVPAALAPVVTHRKGAQRASP